MKAGFLEKLLKRLDRLDPAEVQHYLLRLVQEQGFFQKVFEALQEGVILLDKDRVVTYVNQAACSFFGFDRDAIIGRKPGEGMSALDFDSLSTSGSALSRDIEVSYPERRSLNFYLSPIGDDHELGYVLLIRDITGTRRMTEEKIESDRLSTLTLLAAGVAHELGNPLNSLAIHLQLLGRKLNRLKSKDTPELLAMLQTSQQEVKRLDSLISQFLGAIRPSRPVLQPVQINTLLEECVAFLRPEIEEAHVQIKLELGAGIPPLSVDAGQIKQAFYNLLRNAVQATPADGRIIISTLLTGDHVGITFQDSGRGISASQMGNLFRPFFTTRATGTGLGLLVVRKIIREHQGEIEIRSEEGSGTTVHITLPVLNAQPFLLNHGDPPA